MPFSGRFLSCYGASGGKCQKPTEMPVNEQVTLNNGMFLIKVNQA
jgi:hypothetical protein